MTKRASASPPFQWGVSEPRRLRLNPLFVEWLMGVPIGWSNLTEKPDSRRWETWLSRHRELSQSAYCGDE